MDERLNDPAEQVRIAKILTDPATSAITRRSMHEILRKNGIDPQWATDQARKWKAGQLPAQQPRPAGPIRSAPHMTDKEARELTMALAGDNLISKRTASLYCKENNIPIEECRAFARDLVARDPRNKG